MGGFESYVISMDTQAGRQRLDKVRTQFAAARLPQPTVFSGVDGRALTNEQLSTLATPKCRWFCTPAMVGIALSHIGTWQAVVDRELDACMVLEDDVVLHPEFAEKFRQAMHDVPSSFDILLLGCLQCDEKHQTTKNHPVFGSVRRVDMFTALQCYVISNKGARTLLEGVKRVGGVEDHIDQTMPRMKHLQAYATNEELARQDTAEFQNSTNAFTSAFPTVLNEYLGTVYGEYDWVPKAYDYNLSSIRLGPYGGPYILWTRWHRLFFLIGLVGIPVKLMLPFVALDAAMYRGKEPVTYTSDLLGKMVLYGAGYTLSLLVRRYVWTALNRQA